MCLVSKWSQDTLKDWLAGRLGKAEVPGPLWEVLKEFRVVSDVLVEEDAELQAKTRNELLQVARRQLRYASEMAANGEVRTPAATSGDKERAARYEADLSADALLVARAEALSLYWSKVAAAKSDVIWFRKRFLGGSAISASSAANLILSPAASILTAGMFERKGIPVVGHGSEILELEQGYIGPEKVHEEGARSDKPYRYWGKLKVTWAEGAVQVPFRWNASRPPAALAIWDGEEERLVSAWRTSILWNLHNVATKLVRHFPWESSYAAWFVLTDEPPWVPPLSARASGPDTHLNHGSITITAAHWVPKEAVGKFYAEVKSRMNPSSSPSPRRLALFRFVAENSSGISSIHTVGLQPPSWRTLQRMWNEEHPPGNDWHYADVRNLRRDFRAAFESLVNPFR